jgi:hypothetical protein
MPVFFNGRLWISPATMSKVDDSAMYNKNLSVGNLLAIVGKSEGGKPNTALRFGSPSEARAVLRSGEALKAIEKAFDPSAQTYGPSTIVYVRVNPAVQSALALKNASAADVITLASTDYGKYTNQIKVKVETGTTGKKLSTQFGNDFYTEDNLYRRAFSIVYTGSQATATLTLTATAATIAIAVVGSTVLDLNDFPTIGSLVDKINTIVPADLTATVLDGNLEKPSLNGLDGVTTQTIKTSAYTVTATLQACVDWINGTGEGFVTATRVTGAVLPPADINWTYLSGGSDGTVSNTEWDNAFTALQTEDVQWIVPVSADASIHDMADTHCTFMSNIMRMERRAIVGPNTGTTDAVAIAAAKALNSDRISYTHLGFYDYNDAGDLTLYPPYILAALLAGMFSGVNPGTALTNKALKISGVERKLRNPTDTDLLLQGGVLPIEDTIQGYKVVQSITTWLINDNYNRVEVSTGCACDFVSRNVRNALDPLRGEKMGPFLLGQAVSRTETCLIELARPEPMGPAVIVGDAQSPAYKNITASIEGDVLRVEFQCSPVIPCNYIPIVIHAVPYSGTLTSA